jgi:hypothetical protein
MVKSVNKPRRVGMSTKDNISQDMENSDSAREGGLPRGVMLKVSGTGPAHDPISEFSHPVPKR